MLDFKFKNSTLYYRERERESSIQEELFCTKLVHYFVVHFIIAFLSVLDNLAGLKN